MQKFMCVYQDNDEDGTGASFYDHYSEARNAKMNYECGLGWYCEIYERKEIPDQGFEYVLIEA